MMITLPKIDIEFNEEKHIYTDNGVRLPSVTQIMQPLSWMAYSSVPSDTLAEAAKRGTEVHEAISDYLTYDILKYNAETEPYIRAFQKFQEDYRPDWIASEFRVRHKFMPYAGTIDLIGYVTPDDGTGVDVVDLKCTSQYHKVLLDTQLGAYAEALRSHVVPIRNCYGLQLLKTKQYRFVLQDNVSGYQLFLHCVALDNAVRRSKNV